MSVAISAALTFRVGIAIRFSASLIQIQPNMHIERRLRAVLPVLALFMVERGPRHSRSLQARTECAVYRCTA